MGTAGDDDGWREVGSEQAESVINAGPEHRRRPPIVVSRAENDDGINRLTLILPADIPDPPYRRRVTDDCDEQQPSPPASHRVNDSPS